MTKLDVIYDMDRGPQAATSADLYINRLFTPAPAVSGELSSREAVLVDSDATAILRNLLNVIDGFVLTCRNDASYTVVYVSIGFEHILGHDLERFMARGADYAALIHPEDVGPVGIAVAEALACQTRWQIGYRLKTDDGGWRHVLETGVGRYNPDGPIEYLDCVILDFARMNDLVGRLETGKAAVEDIGSSVAKIVGMLQTLRMLSFNARIEAAHSGAGPGFHEVAREMGDLASVGDDVARSISLQLGHLRRVVHA